MQFEKNIIYRPAPNTLSLHDAEKSLGHFIIKNLIAAGDKTVIICGLTGKTLSAKELLDKSIEIARALLANGIRQGDAVSIISENRFEFAYVLLGTFFVNCAFAPLNHTYSARELAHAVNLSRPKFIFTSRSTINTVTKIARELSYIRKIIQFDDCDDLPVIDSVVSLKSFVKSTNLKDVIFAPEPVNLLTSSCLIMCSSGTTGLPKGVQLSQFTILVTLCDLKEDVFSKSNVGNGEIIILGLLPMFHIFGIIVLITNVATTFGKIVMLPKFDEKSFLGCIEKYRCSVAFLVPPLFVFLAKNPNIDKYNLSSLRFFLCGGAPLSKELEQSVKDRLKNPNLTIKQGYAMTEMTSALKQKELLKAGSVGDVNENVLAKVIDANNNALGPNILGELCFKGPGMMMGYIGDEISTKAIIDDDGWLHIYMI